MSRYEIVALTWNNRGGMIGDLDVKYSLTPAAMSNSPPTTSKAIVWAVFPGSYKYKLMTHNEVELTRRTCCLAEVKP